MDKWLIYLTYTYNCQAPIQEASLMIRKKEKQEKMLDKDQTT